MSKDLSGTGSIESSSVVVRAIPVGPDAPATARDVVRAHAAGFPADVIDRAELATSELVTNAVRHGADPDSSVALEVVRTEVGLVVAVVDPGRSTPTDPEPKGGFGLDIVRDIADELFVDAADGWTVRAVFKIERRS